MASRAEPRQVVLASSATVRGYSRDWLENWAPRRRAESTVREYCRRLAYVPPIIGDKRIGEVTVVDVEDVLDEVRRTRGLGVAGLRGIRNALAAMFSDAVRARLIPTNPCTQARMPDEATRSSPVVLPTAEQIAALLDETAGTQPGRMLVVIASTGCRVGEALGMRFTDVDLDMRSWHVRSTTSLDVDGRVVVVPRTKTGRGRIVALSTGAVAALTEQREVIEVKRRTACVWSDGDLVFPSVVGTAADPRNVREELRVATDKIGYPGSSHS